MFRADWFKEKRLGFGAPHEIGLRRSGYTDWLGPIAVSLVLETSASPVVTSIPVGESEARASKGQPTNYEG